jgi:hypothetical protein
MIKLNEIEQNYNALLIKEGITKTKDLPELAGKSYHAIRSQLRGNIKVGELNKLLNLIGYELEINFVKKED